MIDVRSISQRLASISPSATVQTTEKIRSAKEAGRKIFALSSGDPNIETDPRIVDAAVKALTDGLTHYSTSAGLPALRAKIAEREAQAIGGNPDADRVIITPGGKFALLAALMATVDAGDEVLIPDPGWVSYGPCVTLCGGKAVTVPCLNGYSVEILEAKTTARTKAIIVNSPNNPTARVATKSELTLLAGHAERHNLWIIFDQVYADLAYGGAIPRFQSLEGIEQRLFIVDSFSKTFGMTGWRIGMLIVPPEYGRIVNRYIQHSIYCVPPFIQAAALEALRLSDELVPNYIETFRRRINFAAPRLGAIKSISCPRPEATFYLFPSISGVDTQVAERWLNEASVAVMPGSAFGDAGAGHLRLSLTCPDSELDAALCRIEKIVSET